MTATGLYIHETYCWLGCSPDGLIFDPIEGNGLVEIKCVSSKEHRTLEISQVLAQRKNFYLKKIGNDIGLKKTHSYYYQIQGQLEIVKREFCDFVVFTEKDLFIQRVYRDKKFGLKRCFPN